MGGDAVELVIRFAETLIAVTRVRPGQRFVIGRSRKVDLALDVPDRVLVDGLAVHTDEGKFTLAQFQYVKLAFGLVTIELTRVPDHVIPLPRPETSLRLLPFLAGAFVAHLAVVLVALWVADVVEPVSIPVVRAEAPPRVMPKRVPEPKPKPKPATRRAKAASVASTAPEPSTAPSTAAGARQEARQAGILSSASLSDLSAVIGTKNLAAELADVGPIYDEDAANAKNFGGSGGNFRPEEDPRFDSVKAGPVAIKGNMGQSYRFPAHGKFREVQRPPIMGLTCDDAQCKIAGSLDRFAVRDYVEKRYVDFLKCYERHARNVPRMELTLKFEIGSDGKPVEVHAEEPSAFGTCVVRIVERAKFPSDKPTQVMAYPIAFWRT